jgi:hypothetical protein
MIQTIISDLPSMFSTSTLILDGPQMLCQSHPSQEQPPVIRGASEAVQGRGSRPHNTCGDTPSSLPSISRYFILDGPQMLCQSHPSQEQPPVIINCQVSNAGPRNNLQIETYDAMILICFQ